MAVRRVFIVGQGRCGTSLLARSLDAHPEVQMMRNDDGALIAPEPKWFMRTENVLTAASVRRGSLAGRWDDHFDSDVRVRGEKSAAYLSSGVAPYRIATAFPDALIVVCLRNPVERAISNYWYSVHEGVEHEPIDAALRYRENWLRSYDTDRMVQSPYEYVRRGHYADDIHRWQRVLPLGRAQMHFVIFENLVNPQSDDEIDRLCRFLDIAKAPFMLAPATNVAPRETAPRAHVLHWLYGYFAHANAGLRNLIGRDSATWLCEQ